MSDLVELRVVYAEAFARVAEILTHTHVCDTCECCRGWKLFADAVFDLDPEKRQLVEAEREAIAEYLDDVDPVEARRLMQDAREAAEAEAIADRIGVEEAPGVVAFVKRGRARARNEEEPLDAA